MITLTAKSTDGEGCAEFSDDQAMALAQLVKRITWSDIRSCAVDDGEATIMRDAVVKVQSALAGAGYEPR